MFDYAVYCGRFMPLHRGHEAVIDRMRKAYPDHRIVLVLGSTNTPLSLKNPFTYEERRTFLKKVFPTLAVVPLPDYPTDYEWLAALDDVLTARGIPTASCTFFSGAQDDIPFFVASGRRYVIVNRYDGTTPNISATEVRGALMSGVPISAVVNGLLVGEVSNIFLSRLASLRHGAEGVIPSE